MRFRLRAMIDQLNISQTDLASALHVTRGAVTQWLSGQTKPSAAFLALIEEKFGIRAEWLETGKGSAFINKDKQERCRCFRIFDKLSTTDLKAFATIAAKLPTVRKDEK